MQTLALIAVPYITCERHLFLAQETMASVRLPPGSRRIAVINRIRPESKDTEWIESTFDQVITNGRNNVALAWNRGIEQAFGQGASLVVVINLDMLFHSQCFERMALLAQEQPDPILWSATEWKELNTLEQAPLSSEVSDYVDSSCFMADQRLFERVGRFDEEFDPAYHEDSDMLYRIKLAGYKTLSSRSSLFYHLGRGTIKSMAFQGDLEGLRYVNAGLESSLRKYIEKWGGPPRQEVFSKPYNR
jgi:hypothetical protein